MRKETQRFHNDVLAMHQAILFDTLVYPHNLITDSIKSFTFEDVNGAETEPIRGYLALKETKGKKEKYLIEEEIYEHMPVRVNDVEELYLKESSTRKAVVLRPTNPIPFKIKAEQTFNSLKWFIDELAPFEHSSPYEWKLLKICAVMGYVGKVFLGISSPSEFGKSSIYEILHSLTKKSPVFQPRSVPGILIQITGDGNIVFDEVHQSNAETKQCIENFTLQVAGNKPVYINGAVQTTKTKAKYDVARQSITFLYNSYNNYKNPQDEFFDNLFANNHAMDSRILKLKFSGKLLEKFDKNFNIVQTAEENKLYYMKIAKYLLWLQQVKLTNSYIRKFTYHSNLNLKGRHKIIYDEITWLIDMYSESLTEYTHLITVLDNCILEYRKMMEQRGYYKESEQKVITEIKEEWAPSEVIIEEIEDDRLRLVKFIRQQKEPISYDFIESAIKLNNLEKALRDLLREGEIFEPLKGRFKAL